MTQPEDDAKQRDADLKTEAAALRADILSNQAATEQTWKNMRTVVVVSLGVAVVALLTVLALLALQLQSRERGLSIKDCITPGGECYERSLKNQEEVITKLVEENRASNVVIAKCLLVAKTEAEIDTCVDFRNKEGAR